MNAEALRAIRLVYPDSFAAVDWSAALYGLATIESGLNVAQGDVQEPDGTTSQGPWQINRKSWPFIGDHPTQADWTVQARWIGPVVAGLLVLGTYRLARLNLAGASSIAWRWAPYLWRHGAKATLDRAVAVRSLTPERWFTQQIDIDRQTLYEQAYKDAFSDSWNAPPVGRVELDKISDAAGGWAMLGFVIALLGS